MVELMIKINVSNNKVIILYLVGWLDWCIYVGY